jgi:peptidoglycan hydrolase CwlO-like protein
MQAPPPSCTVRRAAALAAGLVLLATVPVAADTAGELESARRRLGVLQERITTQEAELDRVDAQLDRLTAALSRQQAEHASVRQELGVTQQRLQTARDELRVLRDRLADRVRDVYMRGPASWFDFVLGSRSIGELTSRLGYAARLINRDTTLTLGIEKTEAELAAAEAEQERLLAKEAEELAAVRGQHRAIASAFARQQSRIGELAAARREALGLVDQLEDKLAAEEIANIRRVAGKGMPITFGQWAQDFLRTLGAPVVRNNLVVVVAWETAEYTKATWNPLATTMPMDGATVYNSHGVRNYTSKAQGIEATIKTLRLPVRGYEPVIANLMAASEPMETAKAINASRWCSGCNGGNYVIGLIPAVEQHYDRYANQ